MNKTILISALLLASTQAMASHFPASASYTTNMGSTVIKSEMMKSKDLAVSKGHEIMFDMESKKSVELSRMLRIPSNKLDVRSIQVDDSFITVQEFEKHSGDIKYQANVNVKYHYNQRDTND
jgi:phosphotransferase system HPr-like phosphotransfer protein